MQYPIVFVTAPRDVQTLISNISLIKKYIDFSDIFLIGSKQVQQIALSNNITNNIKFIDEDTLYPGLTYASISKWFDEKIGDSARAGWYFQQFLKMAFSLNTTKPFYLLWDSDTIPTQKYTNFMDHPCFDVKSEFHKPYFNTLNKLFPELWKKNKYSFISEHMLIKTSIMKEIIMNIELNNSIKGCSYFEKILNSIDISELPLSGFSEFESYGTYCEYYYPNYYSIRQWTSLRSENDWLAAKYFTPRIAKWLSREYKAVSFDNWQIIDCKKTKKIIFLSLFFSYSNTIKLLNYFASHNILHKIKSLVKFKKK